VKRQIVALLAIAVAACDGTDNAPGTAPIWSVPSNGGRAVAIADGAVIVQIQRMVDRQEMFGVAAYDVVSGKELWRRDGSAPVPGTPLFVGDGQSLERVDVRTGRVLWRSHALCSQSGKPPSYATVVGTSVYAGCDGGELVRLGLQDGRVLASQDRISVDGYQRIEALPEAALAVAGYASIGMYTRSAILRAQTLEPIDPAQLGTPDLLILGARNDEAIVADVCCRGTPDTNSPGAVEGVSLATGDTPWSVAIHPYHPPLPLSDVEPGAGVFVLGGDRVYVGTRTALFVYRIEDLRAKGSKAPRRELYGDLRDRPAVYAGRYLVISEGKGPVIRRSALFDAVTARELWSDASRPWSAAPPPLQTGTIAQMYSLAPGVRRFALIRLRDGKMLQIDTGCYLQAADERYAVSLCGGRPGQLPFLALFDFDSGNVAALPPEVPAVRSTQTPAAKPPGIDPVLARWTQHQWNLVGSTAQTYFFGRDPNGIVAVSRGSGALAWQNASVCSVARIAKIVRGVLYVACPETIAILDVRDGRTKRKRSIGIYGFNEIVPAGDTAVVVEGWNDGAALRDDMAILQKDTLKPVTDRPMSDSTFLGVIGDRAYIDDWCCFGRADQYRPATIYSISLKDGSASQPVDLYPEPDLHPARMQPLGQGARNHLQGEYFYVVTQNYTYRYDVRRLKAPPVRSITPGN
jgi:hypothetical protein